MVSARGSGPPAAGENGRTLIGIAGSHGVVMATAVVVNRSRMGYSRRRVAPGDAGAQWQRFCDAVECVQAELRVMIEQLEEGRPEASILEAYLMMAGDETLAKLVHEAIHVRRRCADWALGAASEDLASRLGAVDDPYMRERSHDIEFVGERLLRALGGHTGAGVVLDVDEPSIVVAYDLSPADTAAMAGAPIVGFVTEIGSRTSHTSIMARALGIPAVVGVKDALTQVIHGEPLIVDGLRGRIIICPDEAQVDDAELRAARHAAMARQLGASRDLPAVTTDGVETRLRANVELPEEAAIAADYGAEGVGLYRTEFLYVNRSEPPSEDEQLVAFQRVIKSMPGQPVTLRTFDIGGDKFVTSFPVPRELNPMLGLRAVRLALAEREVFSTQLRAMLRASAHGPVRIMVPLVSTVDELVVVREILEEAKVTLRSDGVSFDENVPLGVMIEVPGAAVMADVFASHADFMSVGTNDLVQYALAVDRTNRALAYLASPYHPAILRLVVGVIRAGHAAKCPVSVCGEMASEPYGALLLVGLGLRELSMEAVAIPEIKEAIRRLSASALKHLATRALAFGTAREVEHLLERELEPLLRDILTYEPDSAPNSFRRSGSGPSRDERRSSRRSATSWPVYDSTLQTDDGDCWSSPGAGEPPAREGREDGSAGREPD